MNEGLMWVIWALVLVMAALPEIIDRINVVIKEIDMARKMQ